MPRAQSRSRRSNATLAGTRRICGASASSSVSASATSASQVRRDEVAGRRLRVDAAGNTANDVAFRQDADEALAVDDRKRADVFALHQSRGLTERHRALDAQRLAGRPHPAPFNLAEPQ